MLGSWLQVTPKRHSRTLWISTTSSTLCRMPHLNNKQNKNINPIISRQDYHLTQPCPSEGKQTNKNSAQISPFTRLTQITGANLEGQKLKGRKNSTFFKERIQLSLKPGKRKPQTPRLVPVTSGSFSLCLWELRDTVDLVGASRDSTGCGAMDLLFFAFFLPINFSIHLFIFP